MESIPMAVAEAFICIGHINEYIDILFNLSNGVDNIIDNYKHEPSYFVGAYDEYLDKQNPIKIEGKEYRASEVLMNVDSEAYTNGMFEFVNDPNFKNNPRYIYVERLAKILQKGFSELYEAAENFKKQLIELGNNP